MSVLTGISWPAVLLFMKPRNRPIQLAGEAARHATGHRSIVSGLTRTTCMRSYWKRKNVLHDLPDIIVDNYRCEPARCRHPHQCAPSCRKTTDFLSWSDASRDHA